MTHPLKEPKILECLGKHLPRSQIPTCLRVCKQWHSSLEPFLWHTLTLLNQPVNFTPRQATPTLLLRNRHHIRRLHEIGANSLINFLVYSLKPRLPLQLTHIQVSILSPEILILTQKNVETLTSFICRSNRLRKDQEAQGLWCRQLFFILEMVPNLTEFALGPVIILDPPSQEFNKISKNLKRLELDRVKVSVPHLYSDSVTVESIAMDPFPRLESLTLIWNDFPPQCQLELIRKSPNLKSLIWRRGTKLLAESWLSRTLAVPQDLTTLDIGNSHMEDQDMARLLGLIPNLEALNARSTPFSTFCLTYLIQNRNSNMVELELMDCANLDNDQISLILTTMSNLKKFSASMLNISNFASASEPTTTPDGVASPMIGGTPATSASRKSWVCLGLEDLEISIVGPQFCNDPEDLARSTLSIYEQLGKLTELQTLVLKEITTDYKDHDPMLDLSLEKGLNNLSSLKRLRQLDIRGLSVNMGYPEIEWIAKEWTRLVEIKGSLRSATGSATRSTSTTVSGVRPVRVDNKALVHKLKRLIPSTVVIL
ncbi:hypothetical protein BGZ46_008875 [Entomortierella lignicola]|nr:hypothetical protein BGZ46_008875 [Entomortierella lignicola]